MRIFYSFVHNVVAHPLLFLGDVFDLASQLGRWFDEFHDLTARQYDHVDHPVAEPGPCGPACVWPTCKGICERPCGVCPRCGAYDCECGG